MEPVMSIQQTQEAATPTQPVASSNTERIICNGCKLTLEENGTASDSVVVSFGNSLWHVDCFRCAKCRNLVEHDTNLLLLSDGSPVCENCSYICSVCKLPISNEAIVTGEESYHADCFRCRSCSNRIEELIFAKTSQGIYCMTCHNERVTRSRRHAEAKRNKSSNPNSQSATATSNNHHDSNHHRNHHHKKDRDKSSHHRSKSKTPLPSGPPKSPQPPSSSLHSNNLPTTSNPDPSPSNSTPQLSSTLPSPFDPNKSLSSLPTTPYTPNPTLKTKSSSNSLLNSYLSNQPGLGNSHGSAVSNNADQPHPTLQTTSKAPSSAAAPPVRRRVGSASSAHPPSIGPSLSSRPLEPTNSRLPSLAQSTIPRPSTADGNSPSASPLHTHFTSINRSYESSPQLPANQSNNNKTNSTLEPAERNRVVSLKDDQVDPQLRIKHRSVSSSSFDEMNVQNAHVATSPQSGIGSEMYQNLNSSNHTSFSYHDIFSSLDHNPDGNAAHSEDPNRLMSQLELSAIDLEDLLATPIVAESHEARVASSEEITQKVRESISLSRDNKSKHAGELGFDLELVEKLLWELEETKERMKALQNEYHQMRRVSRSAYEGVSLARQKFDNQVLQRENAETKMNELKARMIEQASRLKEMDSLRTLEHQSEQLKDSVSSLQKQLSQLTADRDLRIVELEALDEMRDQAKKGGQSSADQILSDRFEQLRRRYLQDMQELASERDKLKGEVVHLTKIQESQAKELVSLNNRQDTLTEMNATAVKQLEETRTTASRLLGRHGGIASTVKPTLPSPTMSSANNNQSNGQESDLPMQMSPEVNIATTRKFKWGKSHAHKASTASRQQHAKNTSSISTPEAIGIHNLSNLAGTNDSANSSNNAPNNHLPNNSSNGNLSISHSNATSATNNNSGSGSNSMVGLRPHNFQPVSALRPVRCDYCGDKLWGLAEVRCTACGSYSHSKCAPNFFGCHVANGNVAHSNLSSSLISGGSTEDEVDSVLFGNDLVTQAKMESKLVPSVVMKCIEAVEEQGLNFEGIYRKTGGMSSVKMIQNCFEKGQSMNFNDIDKFNDISAITSTLKNYFRQLPNPLFTFELHEAFVTVATMGQENIRLEALERVIYQLPLVHFETLRVLMNHLGKIEKQSEHNKMTSQNLGVIFGPTLLRSSNPNRQFSDMPFTAKIVELTVVNRAQLFRKPYGHHQSSSSSSSPSPSTTTTSAAAAPSTHPSLPTLAYPASSSNPSLSLLGHSSPGSSSNPQLQQSSSSSNSSASNLSCNPQTQSSSHLMT
ncbi:hypothetical protein PCANC_24194 [Puccinia coronata f. sp. avenae]|uniref:Signal transducer n=1 Tax=Puccinia coronata f. sp. avenae TaxID=200324 RepID=A0A2N5S8F8_9BASI|nr:hypothetical protein PCANC_24194 [Puccinia coronata f. sp. avenae]